MEPKIAATSRFTSEANQILSDKDSSNNTNASTVNSKGVHGKPADTLSDIVDLEHPDDVEDAKEDQEFLDNDGGRADTEAQSPDCDVHEENGNRNPAQLGQNDLSEVKDTKGKEAVREQPDAVEPVAGGSKRGLDGQSIQDYIRQTHGIPLESLSIHLIPVKPTVLCRAVDVSGLRHLSLLNVGPQRHLWTMLQKIKYPSRLTSIHTDNVTPAFLSFVNSLDEVTELFMIERSSRAKVEPFASKTSVKIEDIRKQILKKHMKHLRRLMIRNDEDSGWALSRQSVRFLTNAGTNLIELAVGLQSGTFVSVLEFRCFFVPPPPPLDPKRRSIYTPY